MNHRLYRYSTYKLILEMFEKKKVNVMTYGHVWNGKENILTGIIEELNNDLEAKEQDKIKKIMTNLILNQYYNYFQKMNQLKEKKESRKNYHQNMYSYSMI